MAPLRLRHPKGVTTLQVPLDQESYTVQDLLQEIYKQTEILPSRQSLKTGYPPKALTLVPELPISSLDLKSGEQIIVQDVAPSAERGPTAQESRPKPSRAAAQSPTEREPTAAQKVDPTKPLNVPVNGGFLIHRVVPDDNSCLFSSLSLIFEQSMSKASQLRQLVAKGIEKDPVTYNDAILGMPVPKYIATITKSTSWGGAIELGILASHYNTEIASIDVETGRIDHFFPGPEIPSNRCIVIYSGIHYDAVTFSPMEEAPDEWHQTLFPMDDNAILEAAKKLAGVLRANKAYTNTATFDLKCEVCGQGLKGEKGARAHAEATGHVRFGEY